jgi:hypothetical protein
MNNTKNIKPEEMKPASTVETEVVGTNIAESDLSDVSGGSDTAESRYSGRAARQARENAKNWI